MKPSLACFISCLVTFGSVALADDYYWAESAGGDFATPEHWSPSGPPGAPDAAVFDLSSAYAVTFGQDHTNQQLRVEDGEVGFNLGGWWYTLEQDGVDDNASVIIGETSGLDPILMLYGGYLQANACTLAVLAGGSGSLAIDGLDTTWTNVGEFNIGAMGSGYATFQNGATVSSYSNVYVGTDTDGTDFGQGWVDLAGQLGQITTWTIGDDSVYSSSLNVGYYGDGTINIGEYATLTLKEHEVDDQGNRSSGWVFLGSQAGSAGHMYVSGQQAEFNIEHSPMIVGESGQGDLHVLNGGRMWMGEGEMWLATQPGSTGWVEVAGAGTTLEEHSAYPSVVGMRGMGLLDVYDGATASFSHLIVGEYDQSVGQVNVTSNGKLSSGYSSLGDNAGSYGEVLLGKIYAVSLDEAIVDSPVWTVTERLNVGREGSGYVSIENGSRLEQTFEDTFALVLGAEAGSNGIVAIQDDGSRLDTAGELVIGSSGIGTMTISYGAQVTAKQAHMATIAGSEGWLTVHGEGTGFQTTAGGLLVGREGEGHLLVEESATMTLGGRLDIGEQPGGKGWATVQSYGQVECDGVWLGTWGPQDSLPAAEGYLTISGAGTSLTSSSQILVGREGYGEVLIGDTAALVTQKGGSTTSTSGVLGAMAGSTGVATVNHAGWFQDGALAVGWLGTGTLNIEDGGVVESAEGFIARQSGSSGAVTLTGASSTWNVSGSMAVGGTLDEAGGSGRLDVNDENAFVRIGYGANGGTLMIWDDCQVNLNGGRMAVGGEVFYEPSSLVVWEKGVLAGNGSVNGTVYNRGTVSPGASAGLLTIAGSYIQDGSGSLKIEIEGLTQYDSLMIGGEAVLDGLLSIDLAGFVPGYDDTFVILKASNLTGAFSSFYFSQGTFDVICNYDLDQIELTHYVPEPATFALLAIGGVAASCRRKRFNSR